MPSENIIIRNCRFKGLHAVVLGSEMSSGVQNILSRIAHMVVIVNVEYILRPILIVVDLSKSICEEL